MMSLNIIISFLSIILLVYAFDNRKHNTKPNNKINAEVDPPRKTDLESYMLSLENLMKHYIKNPNEIDVNTVFGFFLLNVNLNSVLNNKLKDLPSTLAERFKVIMEKNKRLVAYFRMMATQSQVQIPYHKKLKKIATLFTNESQWISQTKHSDTKQIVDPPLTDIREIILHFSSWPEYKAEIGNGKLMPSHALTEKCLVIMAENSIYQGNSSVPKCMLPQECIAGIATGNDIGYGLTNRLLVLIQARFGRRCSVFNEEQDRALVDNLCSKCYKEAQFISMNKYDPFILILEMITLCTLNGNVEFLRRPWLSYILALQTEYGCFSEKMYRKKEKTLSEVQPVRWSLDKGNKPVPGSPCHGPASAGAAAIISAAIKYVLEYYY